MSDSIAFPNLGIYLPHVIKSFTVFGYEIAVYGITMALGILAGMYMAVYVAKKTGQDADDYMNLTLIGIFTGLIGARAYYVIFSWDYYRLHPLEILDFRGGGLALYGSVIGAVSTAVIYALAKKLKPALMLDTACTGLVLGQVIGRWGNFFNREAFGGYTNNLLAMQLPVSAVRQNEITEEMWQHAVTINGVQYIQVHPTFLYEGLWNCGVLVILILMRKKTKSPGELFMLYIALYGLGRFWIESLRTDQLLIPGTAIPVSMVVSAVGVIGSVIFIIYGRKKVK
jgi:phosphatidylglycerol:prolipoprotein diacylglycerol transferase